MLSEFINEVENEKKIISAKGRNLKFEKTDSLFHSE